MSRRSPRAVAPLAGLIFFAAFAPVAAQPAGRSSSDDGFWARWFERSDKAKSEQPHWITPIATTTPRLEQEFRYDVNWSQARPGAVYTENYGNTKGLELIPFERVEIIAGVPGYVAHNNPAAPDGWTDFQLLMKYRLLSANESQGDYILTAFLSSSFPTGTNHNGQAKAIITPTLAYGKGWNPFDIQGTIGVGVPAADASAIGRTYTWNNALQLHVLQKLWPEVELNRTWFVDGKNAGREQTFVTPGLVIGRFPLADRVGLTLGVGVQIAVSTFHTQNHTIILSTRLPF
jgi:hypothetical protein